MRALLFWQGLAFRHDTGCAKHCLKVFIKFWSAHKVLDILISSGTWAAFGALISHVA